MRNGPLHAGNAFAQLSLLLWFPLALVVASMVDPRRALIVIVVGGTLFLPERMGIDLPVLDLDKHSISTIAALLGLLIFRPAALQHGPAATTSGLLAFLLLVSSIMTYATNGDPLVYGVRRLPGLGIPDIYGTWVTNLVHIVLPFFLGSAVFRNVEDLKCMLRDFVLAGVVYMPLVWLEIRVAPFLHREVYGFLQHSWRQMMREGGFRAIVFMEHGLAVALFVSQTVIGAFGLSRAKAGFPLPIKPVSWLLFITLALSKSLASLLYALVMVPVTWFSSPRMQANVARMIALLVLTYPLLRLYDLLPTEWLLEQAYAINPERESSLRFRLENEDQLLAKALERLFFGWGGWGRSRVFDPITGQDLSVTDGAWVIVLGVGGVFLFLLQFGTMLFPVFRASKALRRGLRGHPEARIVAIMATMVAVFCLDLLPNGLFHDLPVLLAGALYGSTGPYLGSSPAQASGSPAGP